MIRKLNSFLLTVLMLISTLNGMESEKSRPSYLKQVVGCFKTAPREVLIPYKPSIYARITTCYPSLSALGTSTVVAAGMTGAVYSCNKLFNSTLLKKFKPLYVGAGGFLLTYLLMKNKAPNLLDALLVNPLTALNHAYSVLRKARRDNVDTLALEQKIEKIEELEKQNPFFLLGECTKEDFGACLLSRTYEPRYRNCFEKEVAASLVKKISSSGGNPIQYTSFACGGGFQDLVILAKVLAAKPAALLDIHLIDLKHGPYTAVRDFIQQGHEVTVNSITNLDNLNNFSMNDFIQYIRRGKLGGFDEKTSDDEIKKILRDCYLFVGQMVKQLCWLENTFPFSTLCFHVHDSVDSYLHYLDEHNLVYADCITAVDKEDEMSLLRHSRYEYAKLCVKTLQKKEDSCNIWLDKTDDRTKAEIISYSLTKSADTTQTMFKEEDKESKKTIEIPVYTKSTII